MKKLYELKYLSDAFYKKYNKTRYPEIENKENRPYMVMLVKLDENTFAIPFRTNIRHKNCYKFHETSRSTISATGLDFSKAVIVNNPEYIGESANIDDKEYVELNDRYVFIIKKFITYVNGYKKYASGQVSEYQAQKYKYTTLQYFHTELGIK